MSELSNLLRQRLGAQTSAENNGAGVHPDADTLTAYSEQLLPRAERQQVVKHLAGCADCRQVLALSQVELAEAATQPVLQPVPVSWWRRVLAPTFGVAGLVATMAVIALLMVQNPHKSGPQQANKDSVGAPASGQQDSEAKASAAAQPETAANNAAKPESTAHNRPDSADRDSYRATGPGTGTSIAGLTGPKAGAPNRIASLATLATPAPPPVLAAGLRKQDFVNNAFFDTSNEDLIVGNQLPSAPQPMKSEARFNAATPGQIGSFSDIPANAVNGKSSVAILTPEPPKEHFGLSWEKTVIKGARHVIRSPFSAPAISSSSLTASAMLATPPKFSDSQKAAESAVAAAPAKTDSAGFAGSGAFSSASRHSLSSAETAAALWKVADGKLLKSFAQSAWEEARTPAAFEFTTVNAQGGQVWAGGTNAGLIHSYDGGNTWDLVKLGDGASGAIVSILFSGNHVQVTTSDDQSWSSADGGKNWARN
ncbi:MAG TPA: zf-HC2 domain-containing protein [Candidatus Angelobacter sp.]|nr:zf-HC2 domain-containing protein [Candidatus Angelobacter sp.]